MFAHINTHTHTQKWTKSLDPTLLEHLDKHQRILCGMPEEFRGQKCDTISLFDKMRWLVKWATCKKKVKTLNSHEKSCMKCSIYNCGCYDSGLQCIEVVEYHQLSCL